MRLAVNDPGGAATGDFFTSVQARAGIRLPFSDIGGLVSTILPYVFGAAGIALLAYLVMGGFQLIFAKGDPKAIQGAQEKITNAIIGFIIVVISYFLTVLISQLLGIQFGQVFGN